jgi:hypothetical protein
VAGATTNLARGLAGLGRAWESGARGLQHAPPCVPTAERRRLAGARPAGPVAAPPSGGRHWDHAEEDEE